jgi:PEP-CTERM motif
VRVLRAIAVLAALAGTIFGAPASAGPLTFSYGGVQTGTAPAGTPPWLTAVFENIDPTSSDGRVRLTLTANLQGRDEFITNVRFNLNPDLDGNKLTNPVYVFPGNAIVDFKTSNDGIHGPGGVFDFEFTFPTAAGTGRFTDKEEFVAVLAYPISVLHTLTASDFDFLSEPNGNGAAKKKTDGLFDALSELDNGSTPRYSLAHVQGIGLSPNDSGWIFVGDQPNGVPEPGTLALLSMAVLGFAAASRRRTTRG